MRVTVNIDCTPEEARSFMGLPDVRPMQEALMSDLEDRLRGNLQAMSPDTMMSTWLPASLQGAEQMQKMFWSQVQQMMTGVVGTTSSMINFTDKSTAEKLAS